LSGGSEPLGSHRATVAFRTQGLDHVAIAVADLDHSETFYREVLGLERVYEQWDPPRVLASGGSGVALFPTEGEYGGASPAHILHIALRVDRRNFQAAKAALSAREIDYRFSDHGLAHSIYFEDPDGYRLELTTYDV
jgi:catechol 2,3-dioxygenase-like lactoylglutathione lyase family enzyme